MGLQSKYVNNIFFRNRNSVSEKFKIPIRSFTISKASVISDKYFFYINVSLTHLEEKVANMMYYFSTN